MPPAVASGVFLLLILGLFWLDRDRTARTSRALWIAVVWWLLACTRSVGQWLEMRTQLDQQAADQILEGGSLDFQVYSGLLILGLVVLIKRRKQVVELLQGNGPIILFFSYCAVSIFWSDYPDVAIKRWIKALGDLVMVLVVLTDREPYAAFERLLARITYLLIPLSLLLIKFYPAIGRSYGRWTGHTFYNGVALNKNGLGAICLLCGLATVWCLLMAYRDRNGTTRTRQLMVHGVILTMVLWLFWLADSKTSLACFVLGSAVLLAGNLRTVINSPGKMHLIVATILLVTTSVLFLNLGPDALEAIGRNPTLTDRTDIWALLISVSENSLVGTGYESFWLGPRLEKIWSVYSWAPREAHNGYLEIFLNLGWMGMALLAFVMVTGYRRVIASFRQNSQIGGLMLAYFTVGIVYNFTEAAFFRMMTPVWIFLLLTITGAMVLANRSVHLPVGEGPDHEETPPSWSGVAMQHSDEEPSGIAVK